MSGAACALLLASVVGGLGPQTRFWGVEQNPEVFLEGRAQLSAEGAWEKTASRYDFAPGPRKQLDEETGLTYFGARYYDAKRARWISPDPAMLEIVRGGIPTGLSTYAYAYHRPLLFVDPTGERPLKAHEKQRVQKSIEQIAESSHLDEAAQLQTALDKGEIEGPDFIDVAIQKVKELSGNDANAFTTPDGVITILNFEPSLGLDRTLVHENSHRRDAQHSLERFRSDSDVEGDPNARAFQAEDAYGESKAVRGVERAMDAAKAREAIKEPNYERRLPAGAVQL